MAVESGDEPMRALWQTQSSVTGPVPGEVRKMLKEMERKARRHRVDSWVAYVLINGTIMTIAAMFANPLILAGAVLTLAGFAVVAWEIVLHRRSAPVSDDGMASSLEYFRALLRHRLEFHRKRIWLRVGALAPGGILFFLGFAAGRPDLAPLIYFELATFVFALMLIVPVNRRAAAKLQRQIDELEALQ